MFTTDVLGSLLCGYQPLQEVPRVHHTMRQALPWQASFGGATPHLRHFRRCLRQHVDQPRESIYVDYVSFFKILKKPSKNSKVKKYMIYKCTKKLIKKAPSIGQGRCFFQSFAMGSRTFVIRFVLSKDPFHQQRRVWCRKD